jgi:orotidine-5'-phosphate decarboxylase
MHERVIVALDVADQAAAEQLTAQLPAVKFWKIGLELFVATGSTFVHRLKVQDKRIFLDLKLHDIPNTVAGACRNISDLGVDFLTVHAVGGAAMIRAAAESVQDNTKILAVTLLTSLSQTALNTELQVPLSVQDYVRKLAEVALKNGAGGLVCSPLELALLRETFGSEILLVTPGIRPSTGQQQDQQRTLTPAEAIQSGASYLVVGRPITQAPNPALAFSAIVQEIDQ